MNDEYTGEDFDTMARLHICDFVNDMAERACQAGSTAFDTPERFIAAAELIEHYITNGNSFSLDCDDALRKCVRGQ